MDDGPILAVSLNCGLCRSLVKDAHMTLCCEGLWCKGCFLESFEAMKKCPGCRKAITLQDFVPDMRAEVKASDISLPCPYSNRGCDFHGKRDALLGHVAACPSQPPERIIRDLQEKVAKLEDEKRKVAEDCAGWRQIVQTTRDSILAIVFEAPNDQNSTCRRICRLVGSKPDLSLHRVVRDSWSRTYLSFKRIGGLSTHVRLRETGSNISLVIASEDASGLCNSPISVLFMDPWSGEFDKVCETQWPATCLVDDVAKHLIGNADINYKIAVCHYNLMSVDAFNAKYVRGGKSILGITN